MPFFIFPPWENDIALFSREPRIGTTSLERECRQETHTNTRLLTTDEYQVNIE